MLAINVNLGPFYFSGGAFYPELGTTEFYGSYWDKKIRASERRVRYGKGVYSASVIVGLTGQNGSKHEMAEIVSAVKEIRLEQADDPGATFIAQKGLYMHRVTRHIVEEDSVRVVILHITSESRKKFKSNIAELAETLRDRMNQEEVIVEFQDRGVTQEIFGFRASASRKG